jgi:hypothetical protein
LQTRQTDNVQGLHPPTPPPPTTWR